MCAQRSLVASSSKLSPDRNGVGSGVVGAAVEMEMVLLRAGTLERNDAPKGTVARSAARKLIGAG